MFLRIIVSCYLFIALPDNLSTNPSILNPDKSAIYTALSTNDSTSVNDLLDGLSEDNTLVGKAYRGALLMKKASFLKPPNKKLKTFKSGHDLLEAAIENQPDNIEFRFLRLIIQENAPKFLTYHEEIDTDANYIKANFHQLTPDIKREIVEYSLSSNALNPDDFN